MQLIPVFDQGIRRK